MRSLCTAARRVEAEDSDVWAANIIAGFAYADTPETGLSAAIVTTGGDAGAERHLAEIGALAWAQREAGVPREWALGEAIEDALRTPRTGPVLLVEPSDNIGGGAPGDTTTILRALLDRGLARCAVVIADPVAVAALAGVSPGDTARVTLGGRHPPDPGPVTVQARVIVRSDGRFTLEDRNSHLAAMMGVHVEMGPCVTLDAGGTTILLTSRRVPPFDLGQLRSQGIVPEACAFIGVKAAVAHRRAYDRIVAASYWVATPGACPSDLTTLAYRRLRRPVFPLDPPFRAS
jgi:microcystin degradation protein MlrC